MAGPSIAVRIIGDLTNFAKSATDTAVHGESAAGRIRTAFTGALGAFNQTGILGPFGEALNGITEAIDKVAEHSKGVGQAMVGIGTATAGIGVGLAALGSKDQAAHAQLQQAVEATGHDYEDYGNQVEDAIKHQEKYGDSANQTQDALRILTQAMGDPAKALQYLGEASDLAAAKHTSLEDAATKLGKAYNGNTKILKEFGVTVDSASKANKAAEADTKALTAANDAHAKAVQHLQDVQAEYAGKTKLTTAEQINLRNAQEAVDSTGAKAADAQKKLSDAQAGVTAASGKAGDAMALLGDKIKGQADAQANTFMGHISALKAHFEDMAANLGAKYGPAITAAGTAMAGLGAVIQTVPTILEGVTGAWEALTGVEYASMLPYVLIIAGLAAIGVAVYELVTHWSAIWGEITQIASDAWSAIVGAAKAVWNWIVDNWPLLLAVLFGPFAIAADVIYHHMDDIKGYAQDVWNWITNTWDSLYETIAKPIRDAVHDIAGYWTDATNDASAVWKAITKGWEDLIGFFTGIPKRITDAASGMWDGIKWAAKSAFNGVATIWNDTVGKVSFDIPGWVPVVGGKSFGFPQMPYATLATGGIVNVPTLALLGEAGPEAVIPLNKARPSAPAVNIEHATFTSEVDVDLLLQRAAWAVQTRVA